jgi:hypothetical protein
MPIRPLRVAAAAIATASIAAGAAQAAPAPLVGSGAFARTAPFIDGSIYEFGCDAAAPGALVTRIDSCTLSDGVSTLTAPPVSSQGPAAATTGSYSLDSYQWTLCWTASASYSDGTTQSTSGCTAPSSLAGAG